MTSAKGLTPLIVVMGTLLSMMASALAAQDASPVANALAEQLSTQEDMLQDFYAVRQGRPAWQEAETVGSFAAALRSLAADGLNPQDYRPDALVAAHRQLGGEGSAPVDQARFDLQASRVLLTALRHLQRGKVDPHQIDTDWEVPIDAPPLDLAAVSRAVDAQRVEQAFALVRPSAVPYERLRAGLARYRYIARLGGWPSLPPLAQPLRPGDLNEQVPLLRERLEIGDDMDVKVAELFAGVTPRDTDSRRYDERLVAAVKRFQQRHLLEVDGIVGPRTLEALNVPVAERIDQIRVNLERARWLLHGLPETFVLVDIAGYRVSYFRPDGTTWQSRIVVGRPYRRTPSLRSEITHLTVNPTWTIPPTIRREDVLPKIRRDLGYLQRNNISVLNDAGRELDPHSIDWQNPGNVMLRQDAGPDNPLGQVVIRFPNDHMVYLHDTPAQQLFSRDQRAISSGCIRVENVMTLVQLLLDDTDTQRDIRALVAKGETRNVPLERHVPVILHYWTARVGEEGELAFRPDIYDRDDELLDALDRPLTW
ncbi:L,D-transpeptidase family protein [Halomonas ventosae]|uniref:Murein L,D-transpeptidase YcbB/YkuD n=1 Tax=Halomonas ventosae TaxID=229007 RepID=A0A4R6GX21_9GAMM|nr:L,D-transpeptidase family protein [Halomonas ventosae]TDO00090.1 murein L,D-transpeptidase YcbB/YkuD [Halomonas ventosae]